MDTELTQLWGVKVSARSSEVVKTSGKSIVLITGACLGEDAKSGDRSVLRVKKDGEKDGLVVCSLAAGVQENVTLDIPLQGNFSLLSSAKTSSIHVFGRIVFPYDSEELLQSAPTQNTQNGVMADVEPDSEESDEDYVPGKASPRSEASSGGRSAEESVEISDSDDEESSSAEPQEKKPADEMEDSDDDDDDEESDESADEDGLLDKIKNQFPGRTSAEPLEEKVNVLQPRKKETPKRKAEAEAPKSKSKNKEKKVKTEGSTGEKPLADEVKRAVIEFVQNSLKKSVSLPDIGVEVQKKFQKSFKKMQFGIGLKGFVGKCPELQVDESNNVSLK